jgi:hypothetical protein
VEHGERFARGHACPLCGPASIAPTGPIESIAPPRLDGALTTSEHEVAFCGSAAALERDAKGMSDRVAGEIAQLHEIAELAMERAGAAEDDIFAKLLNVAVAATGKAAEVELKAASTANSMRSDAIKARRAATESAHRREDWEGTERLERAVKAARSGGTKNAKTASGEVRN